MKSKEMRKMIDKYVPMMVELSELDSDKVEFRAAFILDQIVSDTEKTAKKSLINCIMNCSHINAMLSQQQS